MEENEYLGQSKICKLDRSTCIHQYICTFDIP